MLRRQSQSFEFVHKSLVLVNIFFLHFFLLFHQFILLLHRYLLLQGVLHILDHHIVSDLGTCHDFGHHFIVYHHLVHLVVEHLHLV